MRRFLIGVLSAVALMLAGATAHAETVIRVTLQLPETHSLGQNWLAFKKIIEESCSPLRSCSGTRKFPRLSAAAPSKRVRPFLAALRDPSRPWT